MLIFFLIEKSMEVCEMLNKDCVKRKCEGCLKECVIGDMEGYMEYVEKVRKGRNVDDGFEGVEVW